MTEENLFTPLVLKHHTIKNRILMGSMHTGLEEEKNGFKKLAKFYSLRAKGGVAIIVTGGIAPNFAGRASPFAAQLSFPWQVAKHKIVTDAVHKEGGKICMQILHTGRYAYHPLAVSASNTKSPISPFKARALSKFGIKKTIYDFVNSARLAQKAGYDGIEIMGSEGYLLNQFLAPKTNKRTDQYGGSLENRMRLPLEILRKTRNTLGEKFLIIFRVSMLDLVENGMTLDEVITFSKEVEKAGADIINTGIGWHEARVPTIATMVPRKAFTWISKRIKQEINIPIITTNRINNAEDGNLIIKNTEADMISMARPFLADPEIVMKAQQNRMNEINTCIACNQACLDHIFAHKLTSCLVNPKACHETEFEEIKSSGTKKKLAVIGAGPAGLSFAIEAKRLGHEVVLFEKESHIGGQFNIAKEIPGKEEFRETIRYFEEQINVLKIDLRLNTNISLDNLKNSDFDEFIFSTGVTPRVPIINGIHHPMVISYPDLLLGKKTAGKKVAIIGAGGIGFDTAEFLAHNPNSVSSSLDIEKFLAEWGIDSTYQNRGAICEKTIERSEREIYLLQRKETKLGARLGKTTGWIHRQSLKDKGIHMIAGAEYISISDKGLEISINNEVKILDVENVIICAGQNSKKELYLAAKEKLKKPCHIIGGADLAMEIDAKRAINQGVRLAYQI